ncbi:MAG: iron export ABC transporter permease subunit FetB [Waddliaceae bacterium]
MNDGIIVLTPLDLAVAGLLISIVAILNLRTDSNLSKSIAFAALRSVVQLLLIGFVLKVIFTHRNVLGIAAISFAMLLVAGREVRARQQRPFKGFWGYRIGLGSMFISSFAVTILTLLIIIEPIPWYNPQYSIPILGMLLGNTMTGIALALDRLTQSAWEQRSMIEQRLLLGQHHREAIKDLKVASLRVGMTPNINSMAAAGIVFLPGMMTGQILAGNSPTEAAKYQILILFLIGAGTGIGTYLGISIGSRHLFDERDRLRLDRLSSKTTTSKRGKKG